MSEIIYLESVVKMPLMNLPVRTVYIKTDTAGILISPGSQLTQDDYKQIDMVTDIIAPNLFHMGGVEKASALFPKAKKWAPLGARKFKPEIQWDQDLTEESWPYHSLLEAIYIQGVPRFNEFVFFEPQSKSLIVTDLCFNLQKVKGIGPWIILNLFGTYKKPGISKFWLKFMKDKELLQKSLNKLLQLDFNRIVVSHGDNIESNAKSEFRKILESRGFFSK